MNDKATEIPANAAAELHGGACQTLTAVHLHASVLSKKMTKSCPELLADFRELEKLISRARVELGAVVKRWR